MVTCDVEMSLRARRISVPGPRSDAAASPIVVLLHGFGGTPDDLAPFARSMGLAAHFVFPEGPVDVSADLGSAGDARAWWPIDVVARDAAMARGEDRDLANLDPEGLPAAHDALLGLLGDLARELGPAPLVVGGFSQGAMLACDVVLRTALPVAGLVLLSGARICAPAWNPRLPARGAEGLPVLMTHGRRDDHLSFAAADAFHRDLALAGFHVRWVPFDGGHEIPLAVLRELKRFVRDAGGGPASSAGERA